MGNCQIKMFICLNNHPIKEDGYREWTPTATPGSPWTATYWDGAKSPAPTDLDDERTICYWNLPMDDWLGMNPDDPLFDYDVEIQRAKKHTRFSEFIKWYIEVWELEGTYEFGNDLEDLRSFFEWLVEMGEGAWDEGIYETLQDEPEADGGDPSSVDGLGGEKQDYRTHPHEVLLGTIPYSNSWPDALQKLIAETTFNWWECFVVGGNFVIDVCDGLLLKHDPSKNQFPLDVFALPGYDNTDGAWFPENPVELSPVELMHHDNQLGDPEINPYYDCKEAEQFPAPDVGGDGDWSGVVAPYDGDELWDTHEGYDWGAEEWVDDEQWELQQEAIYAPPPDDHDECLDVVPVLEQMMDEQEQYEQQYWPSTLNAKWVFSLLSEWGMFVPYVVIYLFRPILKPPFVHRSSGLR